ncbi:probable chitinase 10 [Cloeon dipterum]|uniref:probable chitinase 10 n=1 Tax=Cloeon dipterum TaxID=197152 RepID=UPI00321FCBC8
MFELGESTFRAQKYGSRRAFKSSKMSLCFIIFLVLPLRALSICESPINSSRGNLKSVVANCIADCLGLRSGNICNVNYKTVVNQVCNVNRSFEPTFQVSEQKIMFCNAANENINTASKLNLCTHAAFGPWFTFNSVKTDFEPMQDVIGRQIKWKEIAQQRGVKTVLTFGSRTPEGGLNAANWSILAASPDSRTRLTGQLIKLMDENQFDGIKVHWHYSGCPNNNCVAGNKNDKENLVLLMKALYAAVKERGKLLFLLLPNWEVYLSKGYDLVKLWSQVDYFFLETFHYNNEDGTCYLDYIAPLNRIKYNLAYVRQYLADPTRMKKVLVGFTSNTVLYKLSKPNLKPKLKDSVVDFSSQKYKTMCKYVREENFTLLLDDTNGNFAHNTTHVYAYEDYNSLKLKVEFVKSTGMAGMYFDGIVEDDVSNECKCGPMPILRIASELLHGGGCDVKQCLS